MMIDITITNLGTGHSFSLDVPMWAIPAVGDRLKIFYGVYGKPANFHVFGEVTGRDFDYTPVKGPLINVNILLSTHIPAETQGLVGRYGDVPHKPA